MHILELSSVIQIQPKYKMFLFPWNISLIIVEQYREAPLVADPWEF